MAYEWIGAAAAAAGQLGSSIAMSTKKRGSTRMMQVSKELARYNTQLSEEMYNKYESPIAKMNAYKEAGLNPNLIYENAGGGMPSAGQVSTNPGDYEENRESGFGQAMSGLAAAVNAYQDFKGKQIANTNASLAGQLAIEQIESQRDQNDFNRASRSYQLEQMAVKTAQDTLDYNIARETKLIRAKGDIKEQEARIRNSDMSTKEKERNIRHLDKVDEQIDAAIEYVKTQTADLKQDMSFAKAYHPYKLSGMAISNMLNRQKFDQNQEMFGYQRDADSDQISAY